MEDQRSETQQGIQARADKRLKSVAGVISQFSYDVVAGTLSRIITDLNLPKEEFDLLTNQMEKIERSLQSGK